MRILVTGTREWTDEDAVRSLLIDYIGDMDPSMVTVVHGDARGLDAAADRIARSLGCQVEPHPAKWKTHGATKAGRIRNQEMVDAGAEVCLAFPKRIRAKSKGTWDCLTRAVAAGIPTLIFPAPPDPSDETDPRASTIF